MKKVKGGKNLFNLRPRLELACIAHPDIFLVGDGTATLFIEAAMEFLVYQLLHELDEEEQQQFFEELKKYL